MTTIIIKNSSTASAAPVAGDLTKGELAVNVTDKKLYTKDNGGSVVKLVGSLGNQEANAVAVTGGAIDGTPIGGTTASTASFTTVSASGNVTLSGGTANGVLYLNGSKVATSGSALTFDGTNFANTAGNIQSGTNVRVGIGINTGQIYFNNTDVGVWRGAANSLSTGAYLNLGGYDGIAFATSAAGIGSQSEQMRLTSTGLGIGTSSPGAKLEVYNSAVNAAFVPSTASTWRVAQVRNDQTGTNNSAAGIAFVGRSDTSPAGIVAVNRNTTGGIIDLAFLPVAGNATFEAMRLDSSGNLGLGVTPSAWFSVYKPMQLGSYGAAIAGQTNAQSLSLWNNAYPNASNVDTYTTTNAANKFRMDGGAFQFFTAPSGTAGNAITFTQAMTLGGTTAPYLLVGTTSNQGSYAYQAVNQNGLSIHNSADSANIAQFAGGGNITLTASGNFAVINGTDGILLGAGATERARIDSSGNLLVGYTTATGVPTQGVGLNTGANASISLGHNGSASGATFVYFGYNGGLIGSITQSGTAAVLYNVTSDQRLKENIVDAPEFGSVIDSIKVRSYDWKADGNHQRAGFVAQELVTVAPEAVHQPADPEEMMAVDYSKLVPMLVKEIQSLRARVAQLESN